MQVNITRQEQEDLKSLTAPKGRSKWFYEGAGITWPTLNRLRKEGKADKSVVEKARAFLRSKEAKALIAQERERETAGAA